MSARILPTSGVAFDMYPQRNDTSDAGALERAGRWMIRALSFYSSARLPRHVAKFMNAKRDQALTLTTADLSIQIRQVGVDIRRQGFSGRASAESLALLGELMARALGKTPYDTQLQAAWLMLNGRLVEMATGEGKTLAAALAAAVAALAGTPVHILTSNDYLVQRDREALYPFFSALSLSSAFVVAGMQRDARANAWRHDVVYSTARELVFDYLRDHASLSGERDPSILRARQINNSGDANAHNSTIAEPIVPGLYLCIVDEADSILLDEAVVPLILSAPGPAPDVDGLRFAWNVSLTLNDQRDYQLSLSTRTVVLTDEGKAHVAVAVAGVGGLLRPARRAYELIEAALAARHLYQRDREYVLVGEEIKLIDELTGRLAEGRQWQGPLHAMVEIKEGLPPKPPTLKLAQLTYQAFFPRYLKLCGMSGTLREANRELRMLFGASVVRVPLAKKNQRRDCGARVFARSAEKWDAVVNSVLEYAASGRPVLIGTDSIAESTHLSALLQSAAIEHQLLTAMQDADESRRIANAGVAGTVTVSTNIAGRGTDIRLDARAAASGGLHVIATICNRSRRIDRQLVGRAARHGDPGSVEMILSLDDTLVKRCWPNALLRAVVTTARCGGRVPDMLGIPLIKIAQRLSEWRDTGIRHELKLADINSRNHFGYAGGIE